jgi:hypothetical protein
MFAKGTDKVVQMTFSADVIHSKGVAEQWEMPE